MHDLIVNLVIAGLGIAIGLGVLACRWLDRWVRDRADRALRRLFDQPTDTKETNA
jgi:hypothetical protein